MQSLTLNIGLMVSTTQTLAADVARQIVHANGLLVRSHAVHQSDSEQTLVADVILDPLAGASWRAALSGIATDLRQDCIAAWNPARQSGALIGPKAAAWGPFNPAYFLTLDGSRLRDSLPVPAAA